MYNFNRLWNGIKRSPFGKLVQREQDLHLAMDFHRGRTLFVPAMGLMIAALAETFLKKAAFPQLKGAEYGLESRRWLAPDIAGVMDFSGTGSEGQFYVMDYFLVEVIGFTFGIAGTTTPAKVDFDLYPGINATGTIIASNLDGTNGTVTAPNATTAQAIGAVVYKNIGETGPVLCRPGNSIDVDVATACTAGSSAMAFVLGTPHSESHANLTTGFVGT